MLSQIFQVGAFLASVYMVVMLGRVIFDWIQVLSRGWRPRGLVVVLANLVYGLTDPPLRWLRRYVKPLRIGGIALDMGFLVLFIAVWFAQYVLLQLAWVMN